MKCDHKLSPVERGTAIQELCGNNLDDIINIITKHSNLVHDARGTIHSVLKKYGIKNDNVETDCYINCNIENVLSEMAVKSSGNEKGFERALSKKFLEVGMFFAILAEAVHKIEKASI